jgi:hypothetical protein
LPWVLATEASSALPLLAQAVFNKAQQAAASAVMQMVFFIIIVPFLLDL